MMAAQHVREECQVAQEQEPRQQSFMRELVPAWRPTRWQVLWTIRSVIALVVVLGLLILIELPFGITLWEWMELLIVPAVIAGGGVWFNRQQQERQLQANRAQQERELEISDQRAQDEALQGYLDQMSQLLVANKDDPSHRARPGNSLRTVARARTLTILYASLSDANLLDTTLSYANLSGVNLSVADLSAAEGIDDIELEQQAASLEGATARSTKTGSRAARRRRGDDHQL
jgi:hypothetical protein